MRSTFRVKPGTDTVETAAATPWVCTTSKHVAIYGLATVTLRERLMHVRAYTPSRIAAAKHHEDKQTKTHFCLDSEDTFCYGLISLNKGLHTRILYKSRCTLNNYCRSSSIIGSAEALPILCVRYFR